MREAVAAVARVLRSSEVAGVFEFAPSALACAEPVAVRWAGFARELRAEDEERGVAVVEVVVCRRVAEEACAEAAYCEHAVRGASAALLGATGSDLRVIDVDTTAPVDRGVDGSGRAVWSFEVRMTVSRGL
jgi:hypothetical protein